MPLDFPLSPVTNQLYTFGGRTWKYNGDAWELVPTGGAQGTQGTAGPGSVITAVDDTSATTHYPVFVAGTGSQTARVRTTATAFSFVPSTNTITASLSGNASTASNISNTGTVTLANATEQNDIYITAPAYTTDQPVKLLNFNWYGNIWSLGNIRSGSTPSNGFGVYASGTEISRFTTSGLTVGGTVTATTHTAGTHNITADTNNRFQQGALILRSTSPTVYLRDTDHNVSMLHCNSNILYVLRGATDSETWTQVNSVWPLQIDLTNNNATFGGTVTASSDVRFKKNIRTIDSALEKTLNLRGVYFEKIETEGTHIGVIAQEVEPVLPEVVTEDSEGKKSVAYSNMVGLLIEAIKEQQEQINSLKQEIESLKR
jgi:hypothetical protein